MNLACRDINQSGFGAAERNCRVEELQSSGQLQSGTEIAELRGERWVREQPRDRTSSIRIGASNNFPFVTFQLVLDLSGDVRIYIPARPRSVRGCQDLQLRSDPLSGNVRIARGGWRRRRVAELSDGARVGWLRAEELSNCRRFFWTAPETGQSSA